HLVDGPQQILHFELRAKGCNTVVSANHNLNAGLNRPESSWRAFVPWRWNSCACCKRANDCLASSSPLAGQHLAGGFAIDQRLIRNHLRAVAVIRPKGLLQHVAKQSAMTFRWPGWVQRPLDLDVF